MVTFCLFWHGCSKSGGNTPSMLPPQGANQAASHWRMFSLASLASAEPGSRAPALSDAKPGLPPAARPSADSVANNCRQSRNRDSALSSRARSSASAPLARSRWNSESRQSSRCSKATRRWERACRVIAKSSVWRLMRKDTEGTEAEAMAKRRCAASTLTRITTQKGKLLKLATNLPDWLLVA